MWASKGHFLITPCRNRHSPKPIKICQLKPYSIVGDYFLPSFHSLVDIKLILIYRQQAPLSLPFAHPWAKQTQQRIRSCCNAIILQGYICIWTRTFFWIRMNCNDLDLPILPSTMGLISFTLVLSGWRIEWSSQALCLKLFDQLSF